MERQKHREAENERNFVDRALMRDDKTVRSTVLNRLSHSDSPALVTREVKCGFKTMRALQNHQFKRSTY